MSNARDRLRIAVQKSGRLAEPSLALLAQCGLSFRHSRDKLFCYGDGFPVDLLLVRDDDIPGMIADGVCELGVVGRNVLEERRLAFGDGRGDAVLERRTLGFGSCRLAIAMPQEAAYASPADLAGLRIATTYPQLLGRFLAQHAVDAQVLELSGSVEIAPRLGTADAICDLVSSGATLAANQLREVAPVFASEAVLAASTREFMDARGELLALLLRRLDGVMAMRDARMLLLTVSRLQWPDVARLLPETTVPTVAAMEGDPERLSVQALCRTILSWQQLEAMQRAGAQGLVVLPVEKMLP